MLLKRAENTAPNEQSTVVLATVVPDYLQSCIQHIDALETENTSLRNRVQELEASQRESDAEPENILHMKSMITTAEFASVLSVSQSMIDKRLKSGQLPFEPIKQDRNYWRSSDVLAFIQQLGGHELGFYGVNQVCKLLGYDSAGGLHKAAKEERVPPKIKLFDSKAVWRKEDIHEHKRYASKVCRIIKTDEVRKTLSRMDSVTKQHKKSSRFADFGKKVRFDAMKRITKRDEELSKLHVIDF